jgi:hypothetical protein
MHLRTQTLDCAHVQLIHWYLCMGILVYLRASWEYLVFFDAWLRGAWCVTLSSFVRVPMRSLKFSIYLILPVVS